MFFHLFVAHLFTHQNYKCSPISTCFKHSKQTLSYLSVGVDLSNAPDLEKTDRESAKHQKKFGKELAKVQKDKEKKKVRATGAVSNSD